LISSTTEMPFQFFGYIVDYAWQENVSKVLVMLLMLIPALLFIMLGARLISDRVKFSKTLVFTLIGFWFIAMIGATILGVSIAKNFTRDIEFTDKKSFAVSKDTLTIKFNEFKNSGK